MVNISKNDDNFKNIYTVCIYGFVLSHGQANVEKGFNINKNSLVENLLQLSLKVLKSVCDVLIAKPHNSKITNTLLVKRKQARSQYMAELKKKEEKMVKSQELK